MNVLKALRALCGANVFGRCEHYHRLFLVWRGFATSHHEEKSSEGCSPSEPPRNRNCGK